MDLNWLYQEANISGTKTLKIYKHKKQLKYINRLSLTCKTKETIIEYTVKGRKIKANYN